MIGFASSEQIRAARAVGALMLVCASLASAGAASSITNTTNQSNMREITLGQSAARIEDRQRQSTDQYERPLQIDKTRRLVVKRRVQSSSSQTSKLTPEFSAPIGNVTAVLGRDVRLVCTVENLGQHQVAWLKEETKTILSIDTNIIITNYRIFLIPDEEGRKWVLHIKDVQESDRGYYQCQVNTQPMRSTSGYLEVVVPPAIIESETTQVVEATEGANVTLQCKASGHPRPAISWRREDGEPIKLEGRASESSDEDLAKNDGTLSKSTTLNQVTRRGSSFVPAKVGNSRASTHLNDVKSDRLQFTQIDRSMAGLYVCSASNGIPSQMSRQIPLYVKFPPKVSIGEKSIAVAMGDQLEIDCFIEAFPKPTSYWSERQMPPMAFGLGGPPATVPHVSAKWASQQRAVAAMRQNSLRERQTAGGADNHISDSGLEVDGAPSDSTEEVEDPDVGGVQEAPVTAVGSSSSGGGAAKSTWLNQTQIAAPGASSAGLVTVKQTAINAYTYKLKITIARLRPADFGEYICKSSNSMGSSSARVLVRMAERNQMPSVAATVGATAGLNRPLSLTGDMAGDNPSDYQRDGMGGSQPASMNSSTGYQQFILASKSVSNQQHLSPSESRRSSFQMVAKPSRVYDENYLQAIRNRQSLSSSGYIGSSAAHGDRSNSALKAVQLNLIWFSCIVSLKVFYCQVYLNAY